MASRNHDNPVHVARMARGGRYVREYRDWLYSMTRRRTDAVTKYPDGYWRDFTQQWTYFFFDLSYDIADDTSLKMITEEIIKQLGRGYRAIKDRNFGLRSNHFRVRVHFPTRSPYYEDKAEEEHTLLLNKLAKYEDSNRGQPRFRSPRNFSIDVTSELW